MQVVYTTVEEVSTYHYPCQWSCDYTNLYAGPVELGISADHELFTASYTNATYAQDGRYYLGPGASGSACLGLAWPAGSAQIAQKLNATVWTNASLGNWTLYVTVYVLPEPHVMVRQVTPSPPGTGNSPSPGQPTLE